MKKRKVDVEKYKKRLIEIKERLKSDPDYDEEFAHPDADVVLCDLLKELGFEDVVELYEKIPKWYA